jgi:coenzyme F420-0:L-glutamate ligase/coenzyme F420-1:gamma-L-glutamate ligase
VTRLELVAVEGIGAIRPKDDLGRILVDALRAMRLPPADGDILVVAQKIVSKAEDRFVLLDSIEPSPRAIELARQCGKDARLVEVILSESRELLRVAPGLIVVEDVRGLVLANAGVDRSNVEPDESHHERVLLLPKDPDASAAALRRRIRELSGADVGVVVNDSLGRAWRLGIVGTAIGVSGLPALVDRRGEPDLQGRRLEITEVGLADELAAAASMLMGQAAEGRPVVLVRGFAGPRGEGTARELQRPRKMDLFR